MYDPELAQKYKENAGEKYRPSNGTEGDIFMVNFCEKCTKDYFNGNVAGCPIIANSMSYDIADERYPKEWQYGADGQPTCTAFDEKVKVP